MLESIRDIKLKNNLTNDMYFLFTDAEELDLYGAEAFVNSYPDMVNKIDSVINLEARGNSGTLLMFQTSTNNKGLANALNTAVDYTSMFSFFSEVYKTMPNDTDLTEFLDAGYAGMNFAVVNGPEYYHRDTDNYENLDKDSAYMYFKTTVDLADYFSTADLETLNSTEDAVYFPFLKGNTIIISNRIMITLSCLVGFLSLIWVIILLLRKQAFIKDCIKTSTLILASILVAVLIGLCGGYFYNKVAYSARLSEVISTLNIIYYILCFMVIMEVLLLIYFAAKRMKSKQTLCICGILYFNIFNWICMFVLSSLSYIFTVPLFLLLLYSVIIYAFKESKIISRILDEYSVVLGLIVLILYTPIVYLLYTALLQSFLFANMAVVGIAIMPIAIVCASKAKPN